MFLKPELRFLNEIPTTKLLYFIQIKTKCIHPRFYFKKNSKSSYGLYLKRVTTTSNKS